MKKTCNDCKALNTTFVPKCDLGYRIEGVSKLWGVTISWKPLEKCPKPKTYKDMCRLKSE